jgi:hypothetical protein
MGAIPCLRILANRHIQTSSQCPLCKTDCESQEHALFKCPKVKEVWLHLGMERIIQDACDMERHGPLVLADLLLSQSGMAPFLPPFLPEVTLVELIMTAIWYIWWERRQATHGELIRQPVRTAHAILTLVTNYSRARKKDNQ